MPSQNPTIQWVKPLGGEPYSLIARKALGDDGGLFNDDVPEFTQRLDNPRFRAEYWQIAHIDCFGKLAGVEVEVRFVVQLRRVTAVGATGCYRQEEVAGAAWGLRHRRVAFDCLIRLEGGWGPNNHIDTGKTARRKNLAGKLKFWLPGSYGGDPPGERRDNVSGPFGVDDSADQKARGWGRSRFA